MANHPPSYPLRMAILVHPETMPAMLFGAVDVLRQTNAFLMATQGLNTYEVVLVGSEKVVGMAGGAWADCDFTWAENPAADWIIVPTLNPGNHHERVVASKAALAWLKGAYAQGSQIVGLCSGAFFLAEAGLLEGKTASIHWASQDDFQACFPTIGLTKGGLFADAGRIWTGGAATSFMTMMLRIVERTAGPETAAWVSKAMLIDFDRDTQLHYTDFIPPLRHGDSAVLQAQDALHQRFTEGMEVGELAEIACLSERQFSRRFRAATGLAPAEYLRQVRLSEARKRLATLRMPVGEVAESVGYSDEKAFYKVFKAATGMSPMGYRKKFGGGQAS